MLVVDIHGNTSVGKCEGDYMWGREEQKGEKWCDKVVKINIYK